MSGQTSIELYRTSDARQVQVLVFTYPPSEELTRLTAGKVIFSKARTPGAVGVAELKEDRGDRLGLKATEGDYVGIFVDNGECVLIHEYLLKEGYTPEALYQEGKANRKEARVKNKNASVQLKQFLEVFDKRWFDHTGGVDNAYYGIGDGFVEGTKYRCLIKDGHPGIRGLPAIGCLADPNDLFSIYLGSIVENFPKDMTLDSICKGYESLMRIYNHKANLNPDVSTERLAMTSNYIAEYLKWEKGEGEPNEYTRSFEYLSDACDILMLTTVNTPDSSIWLEFLVHTGKVSTLSGSMGLPTKEMLVNLVEKVRNLEFKIPNHNKEFKKLKEEALKSLLTSEEWLMW